MDITHGIIDLVQFLLVVGVPLHALEFLHYLAQVAVLGHGLGLLYAGMERYVMRRTHADNLSEHTVGVVIAVSGLVELGKQISFTYALQFAHSLAVYGHLQQRDALLKTLLVQQM